MTFDVYLPFRNKDGKIVPGVKAFPKTYKQIQEIFGSLDVLNKVARLRAGDKTAKMELPAVCFIGKTKSGRRYDADMTPTQFVMVDIDHCKDPMAAWNEIKDHPEFMNVHFALVHITCGGEGLRIVFRATENIDSVSGQMVWLRDKFDLGKYGDYDVSVKNLGRISFVSQKSDILYANEVLLDGVLDEQLPSPITRAGESISKDEPKAPKVSEGALFKDDHYSPFTEEEKEDFEARRYKGFEYSVIVQKYLDVYGNPDSGEKHNYYNEMVKNFRCICDNDRRFLLYILPRFDHTEEECWSQIISICRVNTLSRLPKKFYFFLKDNGFYTEVSKQASDLKTYMLQDEEEPKDEKIYGSPYYPPVFRELIGTAPKDFVVPAMNALLPIMGTLTSYLRAEYPYDMREHSTSFFSVIYAPAGTGKGFVERFLDLLFEDLKLRDLVESERENIYLRVLNKKGANDKAPDMPHVSLRLIPPKNSEAEFLQKQKDNNGYHMFTYAAEMDSWAKGVRAAGGNKDDMIRIAWDNGEYGQQFKSANTFKGTVRLFWNVLITGTIAQVDNYFKNVENGLVTRCSFTSIENQEFTLPQPWKKLSKRSLGVIRKFMARCDANTYMNPLSIDASDLMTVNDDDFDKTIPWRFEFRPKKTVDMSWLMPTIDKFHKEEMEKASLDVDRARDVFRRRVAVRGFRLGIMCNALWENPRKSDLEKCIPFIDWWMHEDLNNTLQLWGAKYNEVSEVTPRVVQRTVFDALGNTFNKNDVYLVCVKQNIKTPVRRIIFDWRKFGYIESISKDEFKKKIK